MGLGFNLGMILKLDREVTSGAALGFSLGLVFKDQGSSFLEICGLHQGFTEI